MSGLPNAFSPPHGDALLRPGKDYELRGNEIVAAGKPLRGKGRYKLAARIAELEEALRSFTNDPENHKTLDWRYGRGRFTCTCRWCRARKVLDHE